MKKKEFIIEVLKAVPDNSVVEIYHNMSQLDELLKSIYSENYSIILNKSNKNTLIQKINDYPVVDWIIHLKILNNGILLVDTYDSFSYNVIAQEVKLSDEFKKEFVDDDQVNIVSSIQ